MRHVVCALLTVLSAGGCRGGAADQPDGPPEIDADPADAHPIGHLDKSQGCVGNFGNSLPNSHGRMDGTIVAILAPGNTTCPKPNDDHLIIEIDDGNDVYRMVMEMQSDPDVAFAERDHALVGPAWSAGWHADVDLDYPGDLGVHSGDFVPKPMLDLADIITAPLNRGDRISVYATVEDDPSSAHLIHRQFTGADGAVVAHPDTNPHYLLTRFVQLF